MFARNLPPTSSLDMNEPPIRRAKHYPSLNPQGDQILQRAATGNLPLTAPLVEQLQRTLGNRYVRELAQRNRGEAPNIAEIQRACACGGTCAHCQEENEASANPNAVQRDMPFEPASFGDDPQAQADKKDPEGFCTPFDSQWEIFAAKAEMTAKLLPFLLLTYGLDTFLLYQEYLTAPSSTAKTFADEDNAFVKAYAYSPVTTDEVVKIVSEIKAAIPGKVKLENLPPGEEVRMSIADFLGEAGLQRQTNYDIIDEPPGVTAGGVGSSNFGDDFRQISGDVVFVREVDGSGETTDVWMTTEIGFTISDAIDFCPGDAGLPEEQKATLPLSRLEASGAAFDRPFIVTFERISGPVPISLTLFQTSNPNGPTGSFDNPNEDNSMAWDEWFESAAGVLG